MTLAKYLPEEIIVIAGECLFRLVLDTMPRFGELPGPILGRVFVWPTKLAGQATQISDRAVELWSTCINTVDSNGKHGNVTPRLERGDCLRISTHQVWIEIHDDPATSIDQCTVQYAPFAIAPRSTGAHPHVEGLFNDIGFYQNVAAEPSP